MGAGSSKWPDFTNAYSYITGTWAWEKELHVELRKPDYQSKPDDLLQYMGCTHLFDPERINNAPVFTQRVGAPAAKDIRRAIEGALQAVPPNLRDGPVIALVYKDFNSYYGGEDGARRAAGRSYVQWNPQRDAPVHAVIIHPTIQADGTRFRSIADLARAHRWMLALLNNAEHSWNDNKTFACHALCYDDAGMFFPCGCQWSGQCDGRLHSDQLPSVRFFAAYRVQIERLPHIYPAISTRHLLCSVLPESLDMYDGCRYALVSQSGEFAMYLTPDAAVIVRGPRTRYNDLEPGAASTYPYGGREPPQASFMTYCRRAEGHFFMAQDCNASNGMCAAQSAKAASELQTGLGRGGQFQVHSVPFAWGGGTRGDVALSISTSGLKVSSAGDVVFFAAIPPAKGPLSLQLGDDGELRVLDYAGKVIVGNAARLALSGRSSASMPDDDSEELERLRANVRAAYARDAAQKLPPSASKRNEDRVIIAGARLPKCTPVPLDA